MNKRLFLWVGVALLAVLLWSLSGRGTNASYAQARDMLLFRKVGHEFLLSLGDKQSRVLPVKKVSADEWHVAFEHPFAFNPDSLIAVMERVLNPTQGPVNYIVNVVDRKTSEVVYSFARPVRLQDAPCTGRVQPEGLYALNIMFANPAAAQPVTGPGNLAIGASVLLALFLVIFGWRFTRTKQEVAEAPVATVAANFIPIGKFRFYPSQHLLQIEDSSIELTSKETTLLRIFSGAPNEVIDRNQLLKQGWEDEGVITGRSLDMYVSKLRKKLQADAAVSIVNVHGKGYRLNC